jgi:hypothetical protein
MDDTLKFDVRLMDRMIAEGKLGPDQLAKYLEALPDATGNAGNLDAALADRMEPEAAPVAAGKASEEKPAKKKK